MVSEMIAKAWKPFKDSEFIKQCILHFASIVCPEKKDQLSNISISANTVAEHNSDMSGNIYNHLREKAKHFHLYSVALDENTGVTDAAQLAKYVRDVNNSFEVTEELLTIFAMHGQTTGQEIFHQLCGGIDNFLWFKIFLSLKQLMNRFLL